MARRYCKPTGTRLALSIPPGLAQRLERSPAVGREMVRTVAEIAALADTTCPVGQTGALKASQVTDVRIAPLGVVGVVAYTQFYAHMVHNGTAHHSPNPWLLNAALSVMLGRQSQSSAA